MLDTILTSCESRYHVSVNKYTSVMICLLNLLKTKIFIIILRKLQSLRIIEKWLQYTNPYIKHICTTLMKLYMVWNKLSHIHKRFHPKNLFRQLELLDKDQVERSFIDHISPSWSVKGTRKWLLHSAPITIIMVRTFYDFFVGNLKSHIS